MKRIFPLIAVLAAWLAVCAFAADTKEPKAEEAKSAEAAKAAPASKIDFKSDAEKVSYAIGLEIGNSLKMLKDQVELPLLLKGLEDNFKGNPPALSAEEAQKVMQEFSQKMRQEQATKQKAQGDSNKTAGEKFLAENQKKEGVKVTESGLQYKVIKEGEGPKPKAEDVVKVNYRGTLIDGKEFDNSYKRGEPLTIPVKEVIKGWTEALQLMKVGGKYEVYIPSDLAYGPQGPGDIGPNATLIFEVELLSIEKPEAAKPGAGAKPDTDAKALPGEKPETK